MFPPPESTSENQVCSFVIFRVKRNLRWTHPWIMVSCKDYLHFSLLTETAETNDMNASWNSLWLMCHYFDPHLLIRQRLNQFNGWQHVYQSWFCCDTRLEGAEIFTIGRSVSPLNVNPYPVLRRFRWKTLRRNRTVDVKVLPQTLQWLGKHWLTGQGSGWLVCSQTF